MTFDGCLARLATLTDAELASEAWGLGGKALDIGYALYHALEEEQRAVIAAPPAPTESARILGLAQGAFGDLRGLLAGLGDERLDELPAAGEWSLRETLAHAIGVERSYRTNVAYSIERLPAEPVLMPADRRPPPDPADTEGTVIEILGRFATHRADTDRELAAIPETALARPTVWAGVEVDVRFRLHRFASHILEHTYQCEKTIRHLGAFGGDARAICRRIGEMRGLHERRTDRAHLHALDAALEEKARMGRIATP